MKRNLFLFRCVASYNATVCRINQYVYIIENNSRPQKCWYMPAWSVYNNSSGNNLPPATVGTHISASKTLMMVALISFEQRRTVLPDGDTLEDVQHSLAWKLAIDCREKALFRKKGNAYRAVLRSILVYGCDTEKVLAVDE